MQHNATRASTTTSTPPEWLSALVGTIADAVVEQVQSKLTAAERDARQAQPPSPWATVEEAATFLRCKPQRIYDLCSAGELRRHREGGRLLILRSDLELRVEAAGRILAGARRANGRP